MLPTFSFSFHTPPEARWVGLRSLRDLGGRGAGGARRSWARLGVRQGRGRLGAGAPLICLASRQRSGAIFFNHLFVPGARGRKKTEPRAKNLPNDAREPPSHPPADRRLRTEPKPKGWERGFGADLPAAEQASATGERRFNNAPRRNSRVSSKEGGRPPTTNSVGSVNQPLGEAPELVMPNTKPPRGRKSTKERDARTTTKEF